MSRQHGFSLIELLTVVAIILIIAAIAVPNLIRSRMAANEASAASSLRTIGDANVLYLSLFGVGFAGELAHLGPPAAEEGEEEEEEEEAAVQPSALSVPIYWTWSYQESIPTLTPLLKTAIFSDMKQTRKTRLLPNRMAPIRW